MRFPVDVTRQKRCPVCKADVPGHNPPDAPRPEAATMAIGVYATKSDAPGPVVLGGDLFFGWDAGVRSTPASRTTLGATVRVARTEARMPGDGSMQIQFCSTACLRQFLLAAVDELERRAAAVGPKVRAARARADRRPRD